MTKTITEEVEPMMLARLSCIRYHMHLLDEEMDLLEDAFQFCCFGSSSSSSSSSTTSSSSSSSSSSQSGCYIECTYAAAPFANIIAHTAPYIGDANGINVSGDLSMYHVDVEEIRVRMDDVLTFSTDTPDDFLYYAYDITSGPQAGNRFFFAWGKAITNENDYWFFTEDGSTLGGFGQTQGSKPANYTCSSVYGGPDIEVVGVFESDDCNLGFEVEVVACEDCITCDQIHLDFTYDGDPSLMIGAFTPTTDIEAVKIDPAVYPSLNSSFPATDWCHYELQGVTYTDTTYDKSWIVVPKSGNTGLMQHTYRKTSDGSIAVPHAYSMLDACSTLEGVFTNEYGIFNANRPNTMAITCSTASYSSSSSSSSTSSSSSSSSSSSGVSSSSSSSSSSSGVSSSSSSSSSSSGVSSSSSSSSSTSSSSSSSSGVSDVVQWDDDTDVQWDDDTLVEF